MKLRLLIFMIGLQALCCSQTLLGQADGANAPFRTYIVPGSEFTQAKIERTCRDILQALPGKVASVWFFASEAEFSGLSGRQAGGSH